MSENYKQQDRNRILAYLKEHPVCTVEEITEKSGAEPLRVYPLLFELEQEKIVCIPERTGWGAPVMVELLG